MVYKGSRYSKTEVIAPLNRAGQTPRVLATRAIPPVRGVIEHIVVEGERLDHIAQRYYGDPRKSWLILDANPEELHPLDLLQPGRRLKIPQNRIVS
jgi:nucleoid-associated protein YgaU